MRSPAFRFAALAALLACPAAAGASGAALLAGPATLPRDLVSPDEPAERGRRFFVSGAAVRTSVDFLRVVADIDGRLLTGGLSVRTSENYAVQLSVGSLVGSTIDPHDGVLGLRTGLVVSAAATWRMLEGYDEEPFVTVTAGMLYLRSASEDGVAYRGTELSLGLAIGKSFAETVAPYLAVKVFGGPVRWRHDDPEHGFFDPLTGNDSDNLQAAVGVVAAISAGFDLQLEVAPFQGRSVVLSVGTWW
jgi:hypothetical protein